MKKTIIFIWLCAFLSVTAYSAKPFKWGAGASCNLNITKNLSQQYKTLNPISVDFGFNFRFSISLFYAQTGIYYQLNKSTIEDKILKTNTLVEYDYLHIPLIAGLKIKLLSDKLAIRPFVGAAYAPLVYLSKNNFNITKSLMNKHQFYWQAGIGLDIWFISLDISYRRSFKPVFKDESYKSNTFNIGLYFNL